MSTRLRCICGHLARNHWNAGAHPCKQCNCRVFEGLNSREFLASLFEDLDTRDEDPYPD